MVSVAKHRRAKILRRARHGEKVVFIPGNHDEALREYIGDTFGDILIADDGCMKLPMARNYYCYTVTSLIR